MYAYEWLDFADKQDKFIHKQRYPGQPMSDETAILMVRGQFFHIFKMLNENRENFTCPVGGSSCPKDKLSATY